MVVQFISSEYPPDVGGVGDYTAHLRVALADLGQDSTVMTRRDVQRWDARALPRLIGRVPREGCVHLEYQAAAYDLLGDICFLPMLLRRVRPRVRSVVTFHDARVPYLFPRAGPLRIAALRVLARASDAVIAADRRDLVTLRVGPPRAHQIPIGSNVPCNPPADFDRVGFRGHLGFNPTDLVVVYFGLLNASKGLDLLLDTFDRLPRARLLLLGGRVGASDPTDALTATRIEGRLASYGDRVVRAGWLSPKAVSAHLLAGDVALLPYTDGASARRGSLFACAEHGLPIVSTEPAGVEVAPFVDAAACDASTLAEAVLSAYAQPERLRAASRALAERVSWRRIAAAHLRVYQRLLYSRP